MSEKTDKDTARMDLYMSALVAARVAGWRGKANEDPAGTAWTKRVFELCIKSASEDDQLKDVAYLARQAITAVDNNVAYYKKCDTTDRIEESRERRGWGLLWEDGPEL